MSIIKRPYRRMLTFSWNFFTNQEVLRRVQFKKARLLADIRKTKVGYFGHIITHSTLQHALLEGKIEDRHSRGRQRTMWMGNITEWSRFGYLEATRKEKDRNYWRQLIKSDPANGWNLTMTTRLPTSLLPGAILTW